jgi:hypothetical protein
MLEACLPLSFTVTMSNSQSSTSLLWGHGVGSYTFPSSLNLSDDFAVSVQLPLEFYRILDLGGFAD